MGEMNWGEKMALKMVLTVAGWLARDEWRKEIHSWATSIGVWGGK